MREHRTIRRCLILVLALGALGGCARGPQEARPSGPAPPPERLWLAAPVLWLDSLAREPMLVEHPSGVLFVSGYGSQSTGTDPNAVPSLWQSADSGATWQRVDVGTAAAGARGNSDVDLAVARDGTLYFATMGFDRAAGEGTHIAIGTSPDAGATWLWHELSHDRFDDRPWVEVAPDGTAHVIWNDGSGVSHAVSADRGATWSERARVHPQGGSSHLAIGPAGEVAVRVTPLSASGNTYQEGVELVAVSADGGATWQKHPVPGTRAWDPTFRDPSAVPRWVEPIAWDASGALYHLWSEGQEVRLGRSTDRGATWQTFTVAREARIAYFPYLVARGAGELAATWFVGRGDQLQARAALIAMPAGAPGAPGATEPRVLLSPPFSPDSWRESEAAPVRDPAGEYLPVVWLARGGLAVAAPIQDQSADRWGFSLWRLEAR